MIPLIKYLHALTTGITERMFRRRLYLRYRAHGGTSPRQHLDLLLTSWQIQAIREDGATPEAYRTHAPLFVAEIQRQGLHFPTILY